MLASNPLQYLLLVLPPVIAAFYFLASFPNPVQMSVFPSLASLPLTSHSWTIYPDDFYAGGAYVKFPYGKVRYWLIGPESGKRIVLIHGLSVPSIIWKDVAPELASQGFRVLIFDLYGRGYSEAPETTYDATLFCTQLALLMQHIKWEKAYVAGISMGGAVAAAFASNYPDLVEDRIALIASAGLMQSSDISRTSKVMASPLVQAAAATYPFRLYLQRLGNTSASSSTRGSYNSLADIVRIQSAHLLGFNRAIASSLRDGPVRGLASSFRALEESKRKVLLLHGTADETVPYKYASIIQGLVPSSTLVTVEGGEHALTVSHSKEVNDALLQFFKEKS